MAITTYAPAVTVTLFKNIARTQGTAAQYTSAQRTVDITPYLGEGSLIQTTKDIYNPEGSWRITFGDQLSATTKDTLYALFEPMDVIEIRGSRTPYIYAGQKLPLLMRGFVGSPRRREFMSESGPDRTVTFSGTDWGKLWMIHGLWLELALSLDLPLLTPFQLQSAFGIAAQPMDVGVFMQTITDQVLNPKIQKMFEFGSPVSQPLFTVQSSVTLGQVVPQAIGVLGTGPFWNIVKSMSDSPWNELWVDDSDATGPVLVFRPAPFKDINGAWIGQATDPGSIALDHLDIVGLDIGRSDANVANYFWTPPGGSLLMTPNLVAAWDVAVGNQLDFNHANNNPTLYGYRKMEATTQLLPKLPSYPLNQEPDQQNQSSSGMVQWHLDRINLLGAMNRDNAVLEEGTISARGREDFRPGRYLEVSRGTVKSEFYLTRVGQSISPLQSWTSTLTVERGTGFVARSKMAGSPYWAEGRPGVFGNTGAPAASGGISV